MQEVTRVVHSSCTVKQGETLHTAPKMWEYWINKALVSNCKKYTSLDSGSKTWRLFQKLKTDQFSKDINKKIKSTRFKTHKRKLHKDLSIFIKTMRDEIAICNEQRNQYLDFRKVNSKKSFSCLLRTKIPSNMPVTCRGQLMTEHTREEHLGLAEFTLQVQQASCEEKIMI